ncbi:MAG: VWA domain-containing protein, partial [Planctomycetota bacterium]
MNYETGNPLLAWLGLAIPVLIIVLYFARRQTMWALRAFGSQASPENSGVYFTRLLLLSIGIVLLVIACMDLRWGKTNRKVPQRGLEIVFALDVSRSMLAQDANPNRLIRAKQQIKDIVGEMAGDRIGLVVFAGEAKQSVPLTNHYNDFLQKLDSVGPQSIDVGGSQLGVALQAAEKSFISKTSDHKTVVLFTDGEDQESDPVDLARKMYEETGVRIFTVGLGDMDQGARIPNNQSERPGFVQFEGQQVWSKLNGAILSEIA